MAYMHNEARPVIGPMGALLLVCAIEAAMELERAFEEAIQEQPLRALSPTLFWWRSCNRLGISFAEMIVAYERQQAAVAVEVTLL